MERSIVRHVTVTMTASLTVTTPTILTSSIPTTLKLPLAGVIQTIRQVLLIPTTLTMRRHLQLKLQTPRVQGKG